MSARTRTQSRAAARKAAPPAPAAPHTPWTALLTPWQVALGLALLHLALVLLSIIPTPHDGGDNAAYLALGRSLQDGGYRELWEPAMRPHTQYPPGWPLILAAAMTLGVKPWLGFKVIVACFSALAVALAYLWARRASTAGVALAVGVLLAIGPGVVDVGRWELSDSPFWAFSMLALWAFAGLPGASPSAATARAAAAGEGGSRWKAGLRIVAVAAVATLLAYATRSAAVPLVVAGAAWMAWQRRWSWLALFAGVVAAYAVPWWLRGRSAGGVGYASHLWYVDPYRPVLGTVGIDGMFERALRNTSVYTSEHLPFLITGGRNTTPALLLGIAVLALAAAGWAMRVRRPGVAEFWLPLYLGLVLIWPKEWSAERFLLPALPMLLVCAAEPIRTLAARTTGKPVLVGAVLVGLLVLPSAKPLGNKISVASQCRAVYGPDERHPCLPTEWDDLLDMAENLRGRLPQGAAVLARKPTLFWAYSGYPSRVYPFTPDPDTLLNAARDARARYVMLDYMDNVSVMYLAPALMQRPQGFCVMAAVGLGRATLFAILPGAETMPNLRDRPTNESANVEFPKCPRSFWAPGRAPHDAPEAIVPPPRERQLPPPLPFRR